MTVQRILSLFIKLVLLAVVMLIVARTIPYDGVVSLITGFFDSPSASGFTHFMLGEPDLEAWESLHVYFGVTLNILISVPVMSALISAFNGVTGKVSLFCVPKEWTLSTLRRLAKMFVFTLLFWMLFRFLPYSFVLPAEERYSAFTLVAVVIFNLSLTIACYWFIMTRTLIKKREYFDWVDRGPTKRGRLE